MSGDFLQIADSNTPQTGQGVPVSPTNPVPVSLVGGSSGPDRELVVTTYSVKTAFTGASVGDTITCVRVLDVSATTPTTVATIWRNETTNTDLSSAPSAANLLVLGKDGATETTLSALSAKVPALVASRTPVDGSGVTQPVSAAALPLPAGAATESTLGTVATRLLTLLGVLPAARGVQTAAASLSMTVASDDALATAFGKQNDVGATGDGVDGTHMAFMKRLSSLLNLIAGRLPTALGFRGSSAALSTVPAASQVASSYTVAGSATSVTIRPLNASRLGLIVTNDSTAPLYLLFANSGATTTNYTMILQPADTLIIGPGDYQGAICGVWSSATGTARMSEIS